MIRTPATVPSPTALRSMNPTQAEGDGCRSNPATRNMSPQNPAASGTLGCSTPLVNPGYPRLSAVEQGRLSETRPFVRLGEWTLPGPVPLAAQLNPGSYALGVVIIWTLAE